MVNFKNLSLALALVAMLSISLAVPMTQQKAYAVDATRTIADATNAATGQSLYNGGRTAYGQVVTEMAILNLQEVDCMSVSIRKQGSATGSATIGVFDMSDRSVVYTFGTKDVSTLTGSYVVHEFCNTTSDGYLIDALAADVFLGVKYEGGDSSGNHVDVRRSNTGSGPDYDGTASYHALWDGSEWDHFTDRDLLFKLTNTDEEWNGFCNQIADNDGHVWRDSSVFDSELEGAIELIWQGNGVGRCYPHFDYENDGPYIEVDAILTGNDLTITATAWYDDFDGTPVRGQQLAALDETDDVYQHGLTNGVGVFTTTFNDLSAGEHTLEVGRAGFFSPFITWAAQCGTVSGVTCGVNGGHNEETIQLDFTVS